MRRRGSRRPRVPARDDGAGMGGVQQINRRESRGRCQNSTDYVPPWAAWPPRNSLHHPARRTWPD